MWITKSQVGESHNLWEFLIAKYQWLGSVYYRSLRRMCRFNSFENYFLPSALTPSKITWTLTWKQAAATLMKKTSLHPWSQKENPEQDSFCVLEVRIYCISFISSRKNATQSQHKSSSIYSLWDTYTQPHTFIQ